MPEGPRDHWQGLNSHEGTVAASQAPLAFLHTSQYSETLTASHHLMGKGVGEPPSTVETPCPDQISLSFTALRLSGPREDMDAAAGPRDQGPRILVSSRLPVPSTQHPALSARHPALTLHPESGIQHPTPSIQYPALST